MLDHRAESLLALASRLFRPDLLAPGAPEIERPKDGWPQPLQVVLDDVVGRAGLDVFGRRFLVQAPRDDEEWGVRRLEQCDPQGIARAERGQRMIREDDVGFERAQCR